RESAPNAKTMLSGRVRGVDGHVLERQRAADAEPQLSATGLLDADGAGAFVEPPLQEDQPRLQVLRKFRKPERPVKPEFPVGELDPSGPDVFQGELPEDCAGDTLDQIVVVDKDAVVGAVVTDLDRLLRRDAGWRLAPLRGDRVEPGAHPLSHPRRDQRERILVVVAKAHRQGTFGEEHTRYPTPGHDRQSDLA